MFQEVKKQVLVIATSLSMTVASIEAIPKLPDFLEATELISEL